jgi:hypothetical protein
MRIYYFIYYTLHRFGNLISDNPSTTRISLAEYVLILIKALLLFSVYGYFSVLRGEYTPLGFRNPFFILTLISIIGSTLYLITFSSKWKPYFEAFDALNPLKRKLWMAIVWLFFIGIFITFNSAVDLLRVNGF